MKEMLGLYFFNIFHPFQIQRQLRIERENHTPQLSLIQEGYSRDEAEPKQRWSLSFIEFLSISWLFVIAHAMFELVGLNWGVHVSEQLFDGEMANFFLSSFVKMSRVHSLMGVLFEVVFFPLSLWVYAKFWEMLITFFAQLFKVDDSSASIKQVINQSFAGHVMLLIPLIGPIIRHAAGLVYLYAGMRENLGMSKMQASMVVLSPVVLFLFLGLIMFISVGMFVMNLVYL